MQLDVKYSHPRAKPSLPSVTQGYTEYDAMTTIVGLISACLMPLGGAIVYITPYRRLFGRILVTFFCIFLFAGIFVSKNTWFPVTVLQVVWGFTVWFHVMIPYSYLPDLTNDEVIINNILYNKQSKKAKDKSPRPSTGPVSTRFPDSNTAEETPMRLISDCKSLNREGPLPTIVDYELGQFLGGLLSYDDDDAACTKEVSPHDSRIACNQEKKEEGVVMLAKYTSLPPLAALIEDGPDLCPLGLDDFPYESSSEYEDLCRGLAESYWCGQTSELGDMYL
jgi:hypothetical protein